MGSVPTALWYGLNYHGQDIRTLGSGNAGTTNAFRVFGRKSGCVVLFIDALKGFAAAFMGHALYLGEQVDKNTSMHLQIIFGFTAVIGHLLPIFCDFKGGKGVATLLGMMLCLYPAAALIAVLVFVLVLSISHYASLSSIAAALSLAAWLYFNPAQKGDSELLHYLGFSTSFLVIFTHRFNVVRLLQGRENKMYLFPKNRHLS